MLLLLLLFNCLHVFRAFSLLLLFVYILALIKKFILYTPHTHTCIITRSLEEGRVVMCICRDKRIILLGHFNHISKDLCNEFLLRTLLHFSEDLCWRKTSRVIVVFCYYFLLIVTQNFYTLPTAAHHLQIYLKETNSY